MNEYARVVWTAEDMKTVADACGYCLTDEQAEAFLSCNERRLQDRLVELGYETLQALFQSEDKSNYKIAPGVEYALALDDEISRIVNAC